MTRPEPRKSSLAGSSPIAPPVAAPEPPTAVTPGEVVSPAAPASEQAAAAPPTKPSKRSAAAAPKQNKYPPKVTFYQEKTDTDRVRGAILHTIPQEGVRTLSSFVNDAVMKEVERLEREYNGGKPFPPARSGELPQGRPLGA